MNLEKLNERLQQLQTERKQLEVNISAYDGAIQDCKYWISTLEPKEDVTNNSNQSE